MPCHYYIRKNIHPPIYTHPNPSIQKKKKKFLFMQVIAAQNNNNNNNKFINKIKITKYTLWFQQFSQFLLKIVGTVENNKRKSS